MEILPDLFIRVGKHSLKTPISIFSWIEVKVWLSYFSLLPFSCQINYVTFPTRLSMLRRDLSISVYMPFRCVNTLNTSCLSYVLVLPTWTFSFSNAFSKMYVYLLSSGRKVKVRILRAVARRKWDENDTKDEYVILRGFLWSFSASLSSLLYLCKS